MPLRLLKVPDNQSTWRERWWWHCRWQQWKVFGFSCTLPIIFPIFSKFGFFRQILIPPTPNTKFRRNPSKVAALIHVDRWTDMTKIKGSYVYWTVHHFDSWIKTDQLDVTCFIISVFTAQHFSNVSTSIFRGLRLIVDLFHMLYCSGSMCVGVTVWFGWGGVVSVCRLKLCFSLHTDTTP